MRRPAALPQPPGGNFQPQGLSTSLSAMMQAQAALAQPPHASVAQPSLALSGFAHAPGLLLSQHLQQPAPGGPSSLPMQQGPDPGRVLVANLLAAFSQPQDAAAFAAQNMAAWSNPQQAPNASVHLSSSSPQQVCLLSCCLWALLQQPAAQTSFSLPPSLSPTLSVPLRRPARSVLWAAAARLTKANQCWRGPLGHWQAHATWCQSAQLLPKVHPSCLRRICMCRAGQAVLLQQPGPCPKPRPAWQA